MARLESKVAIISGGARGQGAAEARLFVAEGARVMIGDILDAEGEVTVKEIGAGAAFRHLDVTEPGSWADVVAATTEKFGPPNVLINNAGVFRMTPMEVTSAEGYMEIIRVNQLGVFLGMQAVADAMREAGGGSIVNISSIAGLTGSAGTIAYSASKWAVRGMTKVAALELASAGIRVNSIHPGVIDTPMLADLHVTDDAARSAVGAKIPLGQVATADQVARLALFLASDESDHSTGSEFVVDGGITAGISFGR
jgi:3alpha(or 20beta)-hydroxysteroid dehydrogenase